MGIFPLGFVSPKQQTFNKEHTHENGNHSSGIQRTVQGSWHSPDELFEMLRVDIREQVGRYFTELMRTELTGFLGRERYERQQEPSNHRNDSYERSITLKGIGEVTAKVPRDRLGTYRTQVLPRGRRYEKGITEDLSLMFLTGISTRSISLISR